MSSDFLHWYLRLYDVDTARTNPPSHVAKRERELGVKLPALLRDIYGSTSLRQSQMLHIHLLDHVALENDTLVFGAEQQGAWQYGIRRAHLSEPDPPIVSSKQGRFGDEAVRLSGFLRAYSLLNRVHEAPCIVNTSYDGARLVAPWERVGLDLVGEEYEIWTNGEAVLDARCESLGARNEQALERAAVSLGVLEAGDSLESLDDYISR